MGWQGDLRVAARVDVRAGDKVDADLVVERRDGDLHLVTGEGTQLMGLTEGRLALAVHDGLWTFSPQLRGRSLGEISGEVRVQSTAERRWPDPDAPLSGALQLHVADIGIWGAWVPPGWRLAGALRTTAALGGRFGQPLYTGTLTGERLGLRNLLEGVNLSDGDLRLNLAGDAATIERFTLKGGDGQAQLSGGITFGPPWLIHAQLQAERFRVLGRVDRNLTVSGQSELSWQSSQVRLDGRFKVDEGLFDASRSDAPTLDEDISVRRTGQAADLPAQTGPGTPKWDFQMGLDVDLGEKLRVRGLGLDTRLRGQIRATAPGGRLAVNGTVSTEGGTFNSYGQKLEIERGNVFLGGDPRTPRLDVLALRPNLDTRVGVLISGNWPTPRIKLYSEPDLGEADKLAWLMTGRAPDSLGRNDTAMLQRAALALLSGEGEAPTDSLLRNLGLTELNLRQGDTDVRETVISLGKQINRRVYVGYERGVNATAGNFQLIYRIAQRFTLRLQTGLDSSLDVIWTSRFQETPADAASRKVTVPAR
jgi:translocation and assembly module TamB